MQLSKKGMLAKISWDKLFKSVLEIRIKNWLAFFKDGIFYRLLHCCPIENMCRLKESLVGQMLKLAGMVYG